MLDTGENMKKRNESIVLPILAAVFLALQLMLFGCVQGQQGQTLSPAQQNGMPVDLTGVNLKLGLSAVYFFEKYGHTDEIPKSEAGIAKFGRPGPPILKLDHQFEKGEVFDSGTNQKVGVLMRGFLQLDKPGEYVFQAKSNDGFQLYIDGALVVSDPGVHGDRLSDEGRFRVDQGGMFPVEIRYFQRKGTAMLQLFWKQPGSAHFSIVPGTAYVHRAE